MTFLWWHWLILGLGFLVAELASAGGFYLMFFGIGAIVVGLMASAGIGGPIPVQLLLFAGLSVGALLLFRNPLLRRLRVHDPPPVDQLVNEVCVAEGDLAPGQVGRVELRGTTWAARNRSGLTITRGERCHVVRVEGLMLHVEPEGVRK